LSSGRSRPPADPPEEAHDAYFSQKTSTLFAEEVFWGSHSPLHPGPFRPLAPHFQILLPIFQALPGTAGASFPDAFFHFFGTLPGVAPPHGLSGDLSLAPVRPGFRSQKSHKNLGAPPPLEPFGLVRRADTGGGREAAGFTPSPAKAAAPAATATPSPLPPEVFLLITTRAII